MEKNRGGRPKKDPSQKRDHLIPLRVSEYEYERLKNAAKMRKIPVTKLIRERLWMLLKD